ncbi:MAG: pirin family protein [Planctomycetota bacterium]|nr:pirin family protein [Planctomycetota bacterium]
MLTLRKSDERGHGNHGWLDTKHSFSFGQYFDRDHMGFRALRVINEDFIAPDSGFGTHPHNDMEIMTYVVSGAIKHIDSLGQHVVLEAGDFQIMTAGTGIRHSEFNPSTSTPTHILQIWIQPSEKGLRPSYQQMSLPKEARLGELRRIASPEESETALRINQDVHIYALASEKGRDKTYELEPERHLWIQVVSGSWRINDVEVTRGDGLGLGQVREVELTSLSADAELLIFDLA